jgi:glycosyltransferase involved in cell wall biosynthesis
MPRIHLWCPSVRASEGGIESYSGSLARALSDAVGESNLTLLVRNDTSAQVRSVLGQGVASASIGALPSSLRAVAFAGLVFLRAVRNRPDLIITTHLNFGPFAAAVRRKAKIPYWVALHGYESWKIQRRSQEGAVRAADLLLPVSAFTREQVMTRYEVPAERMHLLPDTFDPERFNIGPKPLHLLARCGLSENDRVILTVGRLSSAEAYKGHDRLIRALPRVRKKIADAKYLIVGAGDDRPRLEALAWEEKVANDVLFADRVEHDELPDYYRLCDLFAMPSTGEGFGIVFLEALAAGKPVLAGNADGARDALAGGELGVLVDPKDETALAESMVSLLAGTYPHPLVYEPEQLRARAIERFGPRRFKEAVATLLREKT